MLCINFRIVLGSFEFRKAIDGKCIISITCEGETLFAVGTVLIKDDEEKPSHGEIYIFRVTEEKKIERVAVKEVKGAVYDLGFIDNNVLIACINNKVCFSYVVLADFLKISLFVCRLFYFKSRKSKTTRSPCHPFIRIRDTCWRLHVKSGPRIT